MATKWVSCPRMAVAGGPEVITPTSSCLLCQTPCSHQFAAWIASLPEYPVTEDKQAEIIKYKYRIKGKCPLSGNKLFYCEASRKFCKYNPVCADPHIRSKSKYFIRTRRISMFIVVNDFDNSVLTLAPTTLKQVEEYIAQASIKENTRIVVYEIKKELLKAVTLVPWKKEEELSQTPPPRLVDESREIIALSKDATKVTYPTTPEAVPEGFVKIYLVAKKYRMQLSYKDTPVSAQVTPRGKNGNK